MESDSLSVSSNSFDTLSETSDSELNDTNGLLNTSLMIKSRPKRDVKRPKTPYSETWEEMAELQKARMASLRASGQPGRKTTSDSAKRGVKNLSKQLKCSQKTINSEIIDDTGSTYDSDDTEVVLDSDKSYDPLAEFSSDETVELCDSEKNTEAKKFYSSEKIAEHEEVSDSDDDDLPELDFLLNGVSSSTKALDTASPKEPALEASCAELVDNDGVVPEDMQDDDTGTTSVQSVFENNEKRKPLARASADVAVDHGDPDFGTLKVQHETTSGGASLALTQPVKESAERTAVVPREYCAQQPKSKIERKPDGRRMVRLLSRSPSPALEKMSDVEGDCDPTLSYDGEDRIVISDTSVSDDDLPEVDFLTVKALASDHRDNGPGVPKAGSSRDDDVKCRTVVVDSDGSMSVANTYEYRRQFRCDELGECSDAQRDWQQLSVVLAATRSVKTEPQSDMCDDSSGQSDKTASDGSSDNNRPNNEYEIKNGAFDERQPVATATDGVSFAAVTVKQEPTVHRCQLTTDFDKSLSSATSADCQLQNIDAVTSKMRRVTVQEATPQSSAENQSLKEVNAKMSGEVSAGSSVEVKAAMSEEFNASTSGEVNAVTSEEPNSVTSVEFNAVTSEEANAVTIKEDDAITTKNCTAVTPEDVNAETSEEVNDVTSHMLAVKVKKERQSPSADDILEKLAAAAGLDLESSIGKDVDGTGRDDYDDSNVNCLMADIDQAIVKSEPRDPLTHSMLSASGSDPMLHGQQSDSAAAELEKFNDDLQQIFQDEMHYEGNTEPGTAEFITSGVSVKQEPEEAHRTSAVSVKQEPGEVCMTSAVSVKQEPEQAKVKIVGDYFVMKPGDASFASPSSNCCAQAGLQQSSTQQLYEGTYQTSSAQLAAEKHEELLNDACDKYVTSLIKQEPGADQDMNDVSSSATDQSERQLCAQYKQQVVAGGPCRLRAVYDTGINTERFDERSNDSDVGVVDEENSGVSTVQVKTKRVEEEDMMKAGEVTACEADFKPGCGSGESSVSCTAEVYEHIVKHEPSTLDEAAAVQGVSAPMAAANEASTSVAAADEVLTSVAADEASTSVAADEALTSVTADEASTSVAAADEELTSVTAADEASTSVAAADEELTSVTAADEASTSVAAADEELTSVAAADQASTSVAAADEASTSVTAADEASTSVAAADEASTSVAAAHEECVLAEAAANAVVLLDSDDSFDDFIASTNNDTFKSASEDISLSKIKVEQEVINETSIMDAENTSRANDNVKVKQCHSFENSAASNLGVKAEQSSSVKSVTGSNLSVNADPSSSVKRVTGSNLSVKAEPSVNMDSSSLVEHVVKAEPNTGAPVTSATDVCMKTESCMEGPSVPEVISNEQLITGAEGFVAPEVVVKQEHSTDGKNTVIREVVKLQPNTGAQTGMTQEVNVKTETSHDDQKTMNDNMSAAQCELATKVIEVEPSSVHDAAIPSHNTIKTETFANSYDLNRVNIEQPTNDLVACTSSQTKTENLIDPSDVKPIDFDVKPTQVYVPRRRADDFDDMHFDMTLNLTSDALGTGQFFEAIDTEQQCDVTSVKVDYSTRTEIKEETYQPGFYDQASEWIDGNDDDVISVASSSKAVPSPVNRAVTLFCDVFDDVNGKQEESYEDDDLDADVVNNRYTDQRSRLITSDVNGTEAIAKQSACGAEVHEADVDDVTVTSVVRRRQTSGSYSNDLLSSHATMLPIVVKPEPGLDAGSSPTHQVTPVTSVKAEPRDTYDTTPVASVHAGPSATRDVTTAAEQNYTQGTTGSITSSSSGYRGPEARVGSLSHPAIRREMTSTESVYTSNKVSETDESIPHLSSSGVDNNERQLLSGRCRDDTDVDISTGCYGDALDRHCNDAGDIAYDAERHTESTGQTVNDANDLNKSHDYDDVNQTREQSSPELLDFPVSTNIAIDNNILDFEQFLNDSAASVEQLVVAADSYTSVQQLAVAADSSTSVEQLAVTADNATSGNQLPIVTNTPQDDRSARDGLRTTGAAVPIGKGLPESDDDDPGPSTSAQPPRPVRANRGEKRMFEGKEKEDEMIDRLMSDDDDGDVGGGSEQTPACDPLDESDEETEAVMAKVAKMENLLKNLRDKIERLEEEEMSLDAMEQDNSSYVMMDKYKQRFVKVWKKLCEIKNRPTTTGRPVERRFTYAGTRYPEINKKIEKLINKYKIFPDYHDIRQIVQVCNMKYYDASFRTPKVNQVAREAFTDVGKLLQVRRTDDEIITFGSSVTDKYASQKDPALNDKRLQEKLEKNQKTSRSKMEAVINKYAAKQDDEDDDDCPTTSSSSQSSTVSSVHSSAACSRDGSVERDAGDTATAAASKPRERPVPVFGRQGRYQDTDDEDDAGEEEWMPVMKTIARRSRRPVIASLSTTLNDAQLDDLSAHRDDIEQMKEQVKSLARSNHSDLQGDDTVQQQLEHDLSPTYPDGERRHDREENHVSVFDEDHATAASADTTSSKKPRRVQTTLIQKYPAAASTASNAPKRSVTPPHCDSIPPQKLARRNLGDASSRCTADSSDHYDDLTRYPVAKGPYPIAAGAGPRAPRPYSAHPDPYMQTAQAYCPYSVGQTSTVPLVHYDTAPPCGSHLSLTVDGLDREQRVFVNVSGKQQQQSAPPPCYDVPQQQGAGSFAQPPCAPPPHYDVPYTQRPSVPNQQPYMQEMYNMINSLAQIVRPLVASAVPFRQGGTTGPCMSAPLQEKRKAYDGMDDSASDIKRQRHAPAYGEPSVLSRDKASGQAAFADYQSAGSGPYGCAQRGVGSACQWSTNDYDARDRDLNNNRGKCGAFASEVPHDDAQASTSGAYPGVMPNRPF